MLHWSCVLKCHISALTVYCRGTTGISHVKISWTMLVLISTYTLMAECNRILEKTAYCIASLTKCTCHRILLELWKRERNVTVNVEWMWHETCAQGYQKSDMRYVYRVIRNVTRDLCTGLSEMWHETCTQGYQKCDMRHVDKVIRNVTWDMCTGLSEIWNFRRLGIIKYFVVTLRKYGRIV